MIVQPIKLCSLMMTNCSHQSWHRSIGADNHRTVIDTAYSVLAETETLEDRVELTQQC